MGVKERVFEFINSEKISIKQFEERCDLSNGYVSSMRKGFGSIKLDNVLREFPKINREWLLYGEGEMLKTDERDGIITISTDQITEVARGTPVYDLDATCGHMLRNFEDVEIIGYVDLPDISSDVHIITASGDSMEPEIFNNDRISVREVLSWDIIYFGQIYLVLTSDYRMLKYIRKHPTKSDYIILRSENEKYDDVELPKSEIVKLFVVENIISIKNKM